MKISLKFNELELPPKDYHLDNIFLSQIMISDKNYDTFSTRKDHPQIESVEHSADQK